MEGGRLTEQDDLPYARYDPVHAGRAGECVDEASDGHCDPRSHGHVQPCLHADLGQPSSAQCQFGILLHTRLAHR